MLRSQMQVWKRVKRHLKLSFVQKAKEESGRVCTPSGYRL